MSTFNLGALLDLVEKKLLDEGNDDYSQAELLTLYNLTLRDIITLDPSANTVTESQLLAAGTKQACAALDLSLIDISRNMGTDGATDGAVIREIPYDVMKVCVPGWGTVAQAAAVQHFIRVPDDDTSYYVYPPNDGTGYVEVITSRVPTTTAYDAAGNWQTVVIALSDTYLGAIITGMLKHAYDDDSDVPGNETLSAKYEQRFISSLGLEVAADEKEKEERRAKWQRR